MTTENLNKEEEVVVDEEVVVEEKEEALEEKEVKVSPTETSARESGWVPKEDWIKQGKDPEAWRSAREFLERGEFFEEIHRLKDNNKKTGAAFKALVEHHKKVYETAVKEAIAKLKAEKKEALENHELDRVYEIDEELDRVREKKMDLPELEVPDEPVGPTPTFKKWHRVNSWYELSGDDEASRFADMAGLKYRQKHPEAPEADFLEHVEAQVARRFPEVFDNPNSKRVSEVNPRGNHKNDDEGNFKLSPEEERACKMFVDQGVMTRKEYIADIKKMRAE